MVFERSFFGGLHRNSISKRGGNFDSPRNQEEISNDSETEEISCKNNNQGEKTIKNI